jgi:hypothetical protein
MSEIKKEEIQAAETTVKQPEPETKPEEKPEAQAETESTAVTTEVKTEKTGDSNPLENE